MPTKYLLLILTMVCVILMVLSFSTGILSKPLNAISSILVPFQKGLTQVGTAIVDRTENLGTLEEVMKENEELKQTNVGLQRALIKNATGDPAPPEKTQEQLEEEKRAAFIEATVKKTLQNLGQHFEGEKK